MSDEAAPRAILILLVEDNPGDVRLTREILADSKVRNQLVVAGNGAEAMAILRREGLYRDSPRPDVVLLDLNLPGKDGREVLAEIKSDPDLATIPVVILTSSAADEDVLKSYRLQANCYVTKPIDLHEFVKVVKSVEDFWLEIVRLPRASGR
jgi:CheY-like chemotaxis protein